MCLTGCARSFVSGINKGCESSWSLDLDGCGSFLVAWSSLAADKNMPVGVNGGGPQVPACWGTVAVRQDGGRPTLILGFVC